MYFNDSQKPWLQQERGEEEEEEYGIYFDSGPIPQQSCSQGHRSSLCLQTQQGGVICLLCLSNLISNPHSPTLHVSYALSQLSHALSQPHFLHSFLTFHSHFLVSPLVTALFSFDDEPIARQLFDLISGICEATDREADASLCGEFIARVSDRLSSGALAWSRRQVYPLHCLGLLLNCQTRDPYDNIKNIDGLVSNLVAGFRLPSEEIRGEVLFVLYKLSVIQYTSNRSNGVDVLFNFGPQLVHLSVEALMKTQSDDMRLNCVALLIILTQRGFLGNACANDTMIRDDSTVERPLNILFAEAIKGPLLSSERQVQVSTLDLIVHYLSWEGISINEIQLLVEENIVDYVFEIVRLSEGNDPVVKSCLLALDLLSRAEQSFNQRLVVGFSTLIPVLRYVAQVPLHPVQTQTLKLIWKCISEFPGGVSTSHIKELILVLVELFQIDADREMSMLPDTITLCCSILVAIIKSPSSHGVLNLVRSVQDVSKHAILSCLSIFEKHPTQLLDSLYLLKEAYVYSHDENSADNFSKEELRNCILDICVTHLLPWFLETINEMEEELVVGVMETFHSILLQDSDITAIEFANTLVSSSWFSFSFGCLGLFPTEKIKWRVYLMLSSLVDAVLGNSSGHSIKDAISLMPVDPIDLLFLLGQKSSQNLELSSCQSAILLMLYASSLVDERLADEKLVLASLEHYILVNRSDLLYGSPAPSEVARLVHLYGLYRSNCHIPYSSEAEEILFQLTTVKKWDLPSSRIHSASLKWLFQQEKITKPLCHQILNFCRTSTSNAMANSLHTQFIDAQAIGELVASGDNYGAMILVGLLKQLVQEGAEPDIVSLLNLIATISNIFPAAALQLCIHGIGNAIQILYNNSSHTYSRQTYTAATVLVFSILHYAPSEILSDDEGWLSVTVKLLDCFIPKDAGDRCTPDSLLVISVLSLISHHSIRGTLVKASKTIHFNTSLVSMINCTIHEACSKGPALFEDDEETSTGETLMFVLLLSYFSMRSLPAILPGVVDWQNFLDQPNGTKLPLISIHCHDLCRLLHVGSSPVKLVTSYCLLELFTRLSDQRTCKNEELKSTRNYLMSMMAILEGFVYYSDPRVAQNCGLCVSIIFGWQKLDMQDARFIKKNKWCRIIVEELAVSLAVPCLTSSFINYQPAILVAVALLKLQKDFGWMRLVFNDACISGMIENVAANNLNVEMVSLFKELLNCEFLKADQIACLNRVLQACRKQLYSEKARDDQSDEMVGNAVASFDDLGEVCEYLIHLMISDSNLDMDSRGLHTGNKKLLEEIELFFTTSSIQDDG